MKNEYFLSIFAFQEAKLWATCIMPLTSRNDIVCSDPLEVQGCYIGLSKQYIQFKIMSHRGTLYSNCRAYIAALSYYTKHIKTLDPHSEISFLTFQLLLNETLRLQLSFIWYYQMQRAQQTTQTCPKSVLKSLQKYRIKLARMAHSSF